MNKQIFELTKKWGGQILKEYNAFDSDEYGSWSFATWGQNYGASADQNALVSVLGTYISGQHSDASRTIPNFSKAKEVSFSFRTALHYNSGALGYTINCYFTINLWNSLTINHDGLIITGKDGIRKTVISGMNACFVGSGSNGWTFNIKITNKEAIITANGRTYSAIYDGLTKNNDSINFTTSTGAGANVNFLTRTVLYAPGKINVKY